MYKAASLGLFRARHAPPASSALRFSSFASPSLTRSLASPSNFRVLPSAARSVAFSRSCSSFFPRSRVSCSAGWRSGWRSPIVSGAQIRSSAALNNLFSRKMATFATENAFNSILTGLPKPGGGEYGKYFSLPALDDPRIDRLPYSIRILLESAIRNCDNFQVTKNDVEKIIDWENTSPKLVEIPFKPARVLLQDFTGVPAVVDLACMRDAMNKLGSDSNKINPLVPVDLVIDHSVQVDVARSENAVQANMELEFQRNNERFGFLKWGSTAFQNMLVVPPGSGIVHQVNLEYLGRVVFNTNGILYPDSVVGTDSHTTMIDGLGVAGWGVGGIEAEAAMLGQPMSMVLPGVVGFKLTGKLQNGVTATDSVLTVTQMLRKHGVVGKFVEFYGEGMGELSLADRATIANMSPEYGATMGFFPVDHVTLQYLKLTGRSDETVAMIEAYLRANKMFVDYKEPQKERVYSSYLELNLADVEPCISGPKRPHDRVPLKEMKADWHSCLDNKVGFKGFAVPKESQEKVVKFDFHGQPAELKHGSVVIAAITSCTNTSNPSVMLGAGLVAKKACELGLQVKPWVKTSLAPAKPVSYLQQPNGQYGGFVRAPSNYAETPPLSVVHAIPHQQTPFSMTPGIGGSSVQEDGKIYSLVIDLLDPATREGALLELSKKREQYDDLALVLWHSFGIMPALLQEIVSVYPLLSPPGLTAHASNRVCNALALLQCVASHSETRQLFLSAHIPLFLYPFLNTTSKTRPFEYLRLTSLGVIGALVKQNDNSSVIHFLLSTEIIPLCLRIMETGSELSKTVAIFIVQKILLDETGLTYICHTYERFYAVGTVLSNMVNQLVETQAVRLLKHVVRCYLRLSDNLRAREALRACLPEPLRDQTFATLLKGDMVTKRCLTTLLNNLAEQ